MKFRCIVEYEYPVDHKPPVEAGIVLHGDKVVTRSITPLPNEDYVSREYLSTTIRANTNFLVVSDKIEALNIVESASPII